MTLLRLSAPAQADLAHILTTSLDSWGAEGRDRYARLLSAALRTIATNPQGAATRAREELLPGIRSFHLRHARGAHGVRNPVHVIYYREIHEELIEIVRVLHDRMDPNRHLDPPEPVPKPRRR
jgi:toxin ParE1/3/4